jgi:glyoxylase-like metal-dependent hydrolase (beta-lactamase superfamily II)
MSLRAVIVPVTPFQQNCSVIWCDETNRAAVVDPGGDLDRVTAEIDKHGLAVEKILLTHAHLDHVGATADLADRLGVPVEGPHRDDLFWIEQLPEQARNFGFPPARSFEPARWLEQGDEVTVGNLRLDVRHCPGHTPGHVVFFEPQSKVAFVGDVLFQGSIGRTDFPRGDHPTLIHSIRENLFPLGDDVRFVPGHGPMSTFGDERRTNPFVSDRAVGAKR